MTAKNDITGDKIKSRLQSEAYATGWDRVFRRSPVKSGTDQEATTLATPSAEGQEGGNLAAAAACPTTR